MREALGKVGFAVQDQKLGDPNDQKGGFFVVHQDLIPRHDLGLQAMQQFARGECGIKDVLKYMLTDQYHAGVHVFGHEREAPGLRGYRLEAEREAAEEVAQSRARLDARKAEREAAELAAQNRAGLDARRARAVAERTAGPAGTAESGAGDGAGYQ